MLLQGSHSEGMGTVLGESSLTWVIVTSAMMHSGVLCTTMALWPPRAEYIPSTFCPPLPSTNLSVALQGKWLFISLLTQSLLIALLE